MHRLTVIACALAATGLAACATTAPPPPPTPRVAFTDELAERMRAIGERAVREDGVVGLSIGVALDGEIVFAEGFGHANAERTVPATRDTIYDIASVGKQFTAAAIMRLVDDGRLTLDRRVREFIPSLPEHFPNATIEQLLRHTSGFVSGELDEMAPPDEFTRKRYGLELLTDIELQTGATLFAPEETFVYSNAGYLVLGLVVEAASGRRYDAFVRNELLRPNGLVEMTVCERAADDRMADSIHRGEDGSVARVPLIDMTAFSGQGSICSSAVDLLRWSHALNTGRIVSLDSLAQMRSPSTLRGAHETASIPYGFAQRLGRLGAYSKVGHTGTFDGGSASLAYLPGAGVEIAVISNTRGAGTPHALRYELEIAKLLTGFVETPVESQRTALTETQRRMIEGVYTDGREFRAAIEGDDLIVFRDGRETERLSHIGGMRFRRADQPDVLESFRPDGDRAGWWVYEVRGSYLEVLRRVGE
ncbi:MAG: serine hydrolase domain-containing protein [Phycisphaerales bacterium]